MTAIFIASGACYGQNSSRQQAPLLHIIGPLILNNETVLEGLAKLSHSTNLGFSIERELTSKKSPTLAPVVRLNGTLQSGTVRDALNWLCTMDKRYSWSTDGHIINFYPKYVENDPDYPLNQAITAFTLSNSKSVTEAVGEVTAHTSPRVQLAVLQLGDDRFTVAKNISFQPMSLRQALNQIAEETGESHGWQFSETTDFRYVVFHQDLVASSTAHFDYPLKRRLISNRAALSTDIDLDRPATLVVFCAPCPLPLQ